MIDKVKIIHAVQKGLESQFEMYSWNNMIDDLELTDEQKAWAKEHTSYSVKEY